MIMDYFLIDYENTGENGLKGVTELGGNSCTVIFYSENADKISFDMHQKLCTCKTKIEYRKINTGKKNALDFQLSTYLGYLIAKGNQDQFYIVSKDNGYRVVVEFWKEEKVKQIDFIARAAAKPLMIETKKPMEEEVAAQEVLVKKEEDGARLQEADAVQAQEPVAVPEVEMAEAAGLLVPSPAQEQGSGESPEAVDEKEAPPVRLDLALEAFSEDVGDVPSGADTDPVSDAAEPEQKPKHMHRQGRRKKSGTAARPADEFKPSEELRTALAQVIEDKEEREHIGRFIVKYKTKQGVNNAIVKLYGTEKAGELYKKIKPLLKDKKGK